MKLGMGAFEERNYALCLLSNLQQSTINICQVVMMVGVCIDMEI